MKKLFSLKLLICVILLLPLFAFRTVNEAENGLRGKWKISGGFCTHPEEIQKGYSISFFNNKKGFLEFSGIKEKELFTWQKNGDTLTLSFERESQLKKSVFEKDKFIFRKLPYNKPHIELRYYDFKSCGLILEFDR